MSDNRLVNGLRTDASAPPLHPLAPFERAAFRLMDFLQRRAGGLTEAWLRGVTVSWMTLGSRWMMFPVGLERLRHLRPSDGILLVANHRTFSDLYMLLTLLHRFSELRQPALCPVRADFFYQRPLGVAVNLLVGAGRMFPPFFRDPTRQELNRWGLRRLAEVLRNGHVIVGFHPEGQRNRNPDPYTPLRAQPGVGKLVLEARPVVVPAFIHGLTNHIASDIRDNLRRRRRVVAVFGEPMDLSALCAQGDRMATHKRIADTLLQRIYQLGEEERAFRLRVFGTLEPAGALP
ncbi:MAG: 1-acyl-sn-glycerol-3-phosphate acyltransferase [Myxococcales bacterium]|nr:1-acyl-sn-glycerol-3-phosphate acyltransferase [Myxococcales bacterium]